ncbi:MAG: hypothetical protein WC977_13350 [Anaerovoracaceae bacterium]|jgi:hypothetical protein
MSMKVMKWDRHHRDTYAYHEGQWIKITCNLKDGQICTAPETFPRGTPFSYPVGTTPTLQDAYERRVAQMEDRHARHP